jgi:cell division protein FtsI (penicillin-binding protein 3)
MVQRSVALSFLQRDFAGINAWRRGAVCSAEDRRKRLVALFAGGCIWLLIVAARLVSLQVTDADRWRSWASRQHVSELQLASVRGPILDRHGDYLALSVTTGSVYVHPQQIQDRALAADRISELAGIAEEDARRALNSNKPFVWIARQIPLQRAQEIAALGIKGVGYFHESRRFYPRGRVGGALVGRVGLDGNGLSGLELLFEQRLHPQGRRAPVVRDAFGKLILLPHEGAMTPEIPEGVALQLTIDAEIEEALQLGLDEAKETFSAKAAMGVMIDAATGEILALAQSPSENFNGDKVKSHEALQNLVVETVFEPGSVMKPLIAALALNAGVVTPEEMIDCELGSFRYGKHRIKDVHGSGVISFHDVVVRSSNIGMTKVGDRMGAASLYEGLRSLGFGRSTNIGFQAESAGIIRHYQKWAKVDVATHSFGQGVAVTPLQVVRGLATVVNDGVQMPLRLVLPREEQPDIEKVTRVVSLETARAVQKMMVDVVVDEHGTGNSAAIEGVRVGGKTGTAQKARKNGRGYEPGAYMSSFIGFVDPRPLGISTLPVLMIIVDEPRKGSIYGGTVAAPAFRKVMKQTLRLLSTRRTTFSRHEALMQTSQLTTSERGHAL